MHVQEERSDAPAASAFAAGRRGLRPSHPPVDRGL